MVNKFEHQPATAPADPAPTARKYQQDDVIPVRDVIAALQEMDPDLPVVTYYGSFRSGNGIELALTAVGVAERANGQQICVIAGEYLG